MKIIKLAWGWQERVQEESVFYTSNLKILAHQQHAHQGQRRRNLCIKNKNWANQIKDSIYNINSKYGNLLFLNTDLLSRRAVCNENCTYGLEEKYLPIKIIDYFFLHQRLRVRVPFLLYLLKKLEQVNFKLIPHLVWFSNINYIVCPCLYLHFTFCVLQYK